jgi:predicted DNA-binding WGR domain protein
MLVASCTLHFQTPDRKSDKIYKLAIELCVPAMTTEVRYRVLFEYGRRGTELRRGEKSGAVTLETARAIYLQYFREKTAEGYEVIDEMSIPATVGRSPKAAPRPLSVAQALLYFQPAPPGPSLARQLADEARRVQAAELEAQLERDLAAASALRPRTRAPAPSFQPARRKYRE